MNLKRYTFYNDSFITQFIDTTAVIGYGLRTDKANAHARQHNEQCEFHGFDIALWLEKHFAQAGDVLMLVFIHINIAHTLLGIFSFFQITLIVLRCTTVRIDAVAIL